MNCLVIYIFIVLITSCLDGESNIISAHSFIFSRAWEVHWSDYCSIHVWDMSAFFYLKQNKKCVCACVWVSCNLPHTPVDLYWPWISKLEILTVKQPEVLSAHCRMLVFLVKPRSYQNKQEINAFNTVSVCE